MSAHREKAPLQAEASESVVYLDRTIVAAILRAARETR